MTPERIAELRALFGKYRNRIAELLDENERLRKERDDYAERLANEAVNAYVLLRVDEKASDDSVDTAMRVAKAKLAGEQT